MSLKSSQANLKVQSRTDLGWNVRGQQENWVTFSSNFSWKDKARKIVNFEAGILLLVLLLDHHPAWPRSSHTFGIWNQGGQKESVELHGQQDWCFATWKAKQFIMTSSMWESSSKGCSYIESGNHHPCHENGKGSKLFALRKKNQGFHFHFFKTFCTCWWWRNNIVELKLLKSSNHKHPHFLRIPPPPFEKWLHPNNSLQLSSAHCFF